MRRWLAFCLLLKSFFLFLFIHYSFIGLGSDEAQYWTWSQTPDWGYYSKPPGIAWQIWLGTHLFGSTEWGVRSMSLFLSFLQAFAVYRLARGAGLQTRTSFWCGLFMALSPLGILGAFLAITDGGFLLSWTGACAIMVSALHRKEAPSPYYVGGWILVGALFKWPIYFFWFFFLVFRHFFFKDQPWRHLFGGICISLIGLLPSIGWNAGHEWATFRHVGATIQGGGGAHRSEGNLGAFLGSQVVLVSPLLFICLLLGLWQALKKKQKQTLPPPLFFCAFVTAASLVFFAIAACLQKIQGNWVIFAYPTGWIILGWFLFEERVKSCKWAKIGLGVSVGLTSFFLLFSSFSFYPYRLNPFKHNRGWVALQEGLDRHGYQPGQHFLVSDKYQTTSLMSFYSTGQRRAYFLNLQGVRKNQFSYWPPLHEEQQGKTGFFVWVENTPHLERQWEERLHFYQTRLKEIFEEVEFLELAPLIKEGGKTVKGALIFRCRACKEKENVPSDPSLY